LADDPAAREVKALLAEGMEKRGVDALAGLLAHRDVRVRQAAQFALAGRGPEAVAALAPRAPRGASELGRLPPSWGLGQVAGRDPGAVAPLSTLLTDGNAEVRAQAAKVLGEHRYTPSFDAIAALLRDDSPRVRFFAANALGKLGKPEAVGPILAMLR